MGFLKGVVVMRKKSVYCRNGHKVGEIVDGRLVVPRGGVRSTRDGFVVTCPECGAELREWKVDVVRAVGGLVGELRGLVDRQSEVCRRLLESVEALGQQIAVICRRVEEGEGGECEGGGVEGEEGGGG